jgi:hypothetical protein
LRCSEAILHADSAEFLQTNEVYTLTGGVELTRGQERAQADHARFDKKNGRLTAKGNVFFEQPNLRFTGDTAELDLPSNQGWLRNVEYRLIQSNAWGTADTAFVETPSVSHFENISRHGENTVDQVWLFMDERHSGVRAVDEKPPKKRPSVRFSRPLCVSIRRSNRNQGVEG